MSTEHEQSEDWLDDVAADAKALVFISDGTRGSDRVGRLIAATLLLIAEVRRLRTAIAGVHAVCSRAEAAPWAEHFATPAVATADVRNAIIPLHFDTQEAPGEH